MTLAGWRTSGAGYFTGASQGIRERRAQDIGPLVS
jgi:hypothetical protein